MAAKQPRARAQAPPERDGPTTLLASDPEQRYALFTVKLLFAADGSVQRTMVNRVGSAEEASREAQWPGWDAARLSAFLAEHSGLGANPSGATLPPPAPTRQSTEPEPSLVRGELTAHAQAGQQAQCAIPAGQPFALELKLDLNAALSHFGPPLSYTAKIMARPMGQQQRVSLGELQGETVSSEPLALTLSSKALPVGLYHLEAQVQLHQPATNPPPQGVTERLRGTPLVIYAV